MTDRFTVRAVVLFLGMTVVMVVAGCIWLTAHDKQLPDALISTGGVALGGLTGFLISSKSGTSDTQPVQVMNQTGDAVPVTPGDA